MAKLSKLMETHVAEYGEPYEIILQKKGTYKGGKVQFRGYVSFDTDTVKEAADKWPDRVRKVGEEPIYVAPSTEPAPPLNPPPPST